MTGAPGGPCGGAGGVAAIVLAAGHSRRMGGDNKLLLRLGGVPVVARVVGEIARSRAHPIVVVTGHQAAEVGAALADQVAAGAVRLVHNPDHAAGMSTSLRAGLAALPADASGALICLGDMPLVTRAHLDALIGALAGAGPGTPGDAAIFAPMFDGQRGNPVLFGRRHFAELHALAGDAGARGLLGRHPVRLVPVGDDGVLRDLDTPEAFTRLEERIACPC